MFSSLSCLLPGVMMLHTIRVYLTVQSMSKENPYPGSGTTLLCVAISLVFWPTRTFYLTSLNSKFGFLTSVTPSCCTWVVLPGYGAESSSRQSVRTTGLISCLSQLSESTIFAVCFPLSENSCLCLSTFLVIYDRKASSGAVIPLEPEAEFYRMHFTR